MATSPPSHTAPPKLTIAEEGEGAVACSPTQNDLGTGAVVGSVTAMSMLHSASLERAGIANLADSGGSGGLLGRSLTGGPVIEQVYDKEFTGPQGDARHIQQQKDEEDLASSRNVVKVPIPIEVLRRASLSGGDRILSGGIAGDGGVFDDFEDEMHFQMEGVGVGGGEHVGVEGVDNHTQYEEDLWSSDDEFTSAQKHHREIRMT